MRVLKDPVAEGQHRQALLVLAEQEIETRPTTPVRKAPRAGLKWGAASAAMKQVRQAVEGARVDHGQDDQKHGQQQVADQCHGSLNTRTFRTAGGKVKNGAQPKTRPKVQ